MIAGAFIVPVPNAHLLFAMGRADARIYVKHDAPRRTASMHTIDPLARKIGEGSKVLRYRKPLCLEAAHLARRRRTPVSRLAADNPAHRWIMAQALGVVDILVSSKATEHRLSQQTRQRMATILAGPRVREAVAGHRGQAKRLVEFPVGQ